MMPSPKEGLPSDGMTNAVFLRAIFGDLEPDEYLWSAQFKTAPAKASAAQWSGLAVPPNGPQPYPGWNTYFCVSALKPGADGAKHRRKETFSRLFCVVLDDAKPRKGVDPTWVLETSCPEGRSNTQVGYRLTEPLADLGIAQRLHQALAAAGHVGADPNGNNPVRYVRLPVGVNTKYAPPHVHRLVRFAPETTVELAALIAHLGLDAAAILTAPPAPALQPIAPLQGDWQGKARKLAWDAARRTHDNPALGRHAEIFKLGAYAARDGLPEESLDFALDQFALTMRPTNTNGEAADLNVEAERKTIRDGYRSGLQGGRREETRAPDPEPLPPGEWEPAVPEDAAPERPALRVVGGKDHDPRPTIEVEDGRLPENTDDAATYLLEAGADLYQHGNRLVRVGRWEAVVGQVERPIGSGVLIDLSPEWMVDAMSRRIHFRRYDKRQEKWRKVDCPAKIAKTLLARAGEWPFYHLLGFCDSPTLTPSGRVVDAPGFDRQSGLFLSCPPTIKPIGRVSEEDRDAASKGLYSLFDTFPFASDADAAAALAMAMTALLRRVLPSAPINGVSASTPATGKSLLADCISALVTGRRAPVAAIGKDSEELEKRIDSILLKGDPICVFDNVMRAVSSDVLCQVATQPHKSIRVLAQSRIVEAPTNVCWIMTGNNLTLLNDLTRRVLLCNLDAGCERPELRSFKRDAVEHVLKHRAQGIRWALQISKAYLDAGCPEVDLHPFGSFELWDRMVRRPLVWAGWPDPLGPAAGMREQDQEFDAMADLMRGWWEAAKGQAMTAAELYALMTEQVPRMGGGYAVAWPALHEAANTAFGDLGRLSPRDLGYRLRQWAGRILSGMRIVAEKGKTKHGKAWRVEMVAAQPTPDDGSG